VGPLAGPWSRPPQRGFTLIELLVALVVAAVAISMLAVNGLPGAQRGLRFEAERMAQLLALASEEAQVRGVAIRLQADESGYRFVVLRERRWLPLLDDEDLRERRWQESTRVALLRPDGYGQVEFGRDLVDVPFRIELTRDQVRVTIQANGLGMFDVR
jgi:general secretion pathway protein H